MRYYDRISLFAVYQTSVMSTKKSVSLPLGSPPKLTEDARSNSAPNACKHENKDNESILGKKFLPQNKDFLNASLDGSSFYLFDTSTVAGLVTLLSALLNEIWSFF